MTQDVVLSGEMPVIALMTSEVRMSRGQTFEPQDYIARAEKEDGSPAMKEVMVGGRVNTGEAGEYTLTYMLDGESVSLKVIVE